MNVSSWLKSIQPEPSTDSELQQLQLLTEPRKRKRQVRQQQVPTPMPSIGVDPNSSAPSSQKRRQIENYNKDNIDDLYLNPTPRGRAISRNSDRISRYSSDTSRTSPTERLGQLEIAPVNPVLVAQITRNDARIPTDLLEMLGALDQFQTRVGIVPDYLAAEIEARAREDRELYNFQPSTFYRADEAVLTPDPNPRLHLDRVVEVFSEAMECFNEEHSKATWNALVHWPVLRLALGSITGSSEVAVDRRTRGQRHPVHVRAMPCTIARLQGRPHDAKMVDYCFFIDPSGDDVQRIDEIREAREYINHTDYHPLRRRPIVLSAASTEPGEGYKDAQIQLGVWQAAQWALLENLLKSSATQAALIPFLPALIIQGHEWSFAATTRSGRHTILWVGQAIGSTNSVLGVFQIIHALQYIAAWIRDTYWHWYRRAILQIPESELAGGMRGGAGG
ncbi:putative methyltransferase type 11 [Rosellinia necatrix]|uniref:Putative methyltransferase type 11 n=1 Tax=Rosellinia necatrix TaxID=77044 RepID=A0A1W2THC0_ROSNE|nr:putative methyltransferase type 11 [Rosellinia necatrix]